ncbi:metallophosphoesterase family protein [Aureliella helgolandensis]|uniref:Putative metallophosphoesterase YhaO n=1 Tax=Aureliella helgolandensis TaxID=2527968 RepID=A0A518G8Y6_9BACT|nr:DNA repair exonuclease [Aureliella helgolandensis]QDV25064.1 putative metallophosphoesterase YhaO [Aureliella helgolandensis]
MTQTRFIHVADVHLDSPLAALKRGDESTGELLERASRRSMELLVQNAIEHDVSAVVIAGDLFDGPVKDAGAGLWVESQFRRLTREKIPVVLIRGNHDAQSGAGKVIEWPTGVHELGAKAPESILLEAAGLAIHGQSFGARSETRDLAVNYPDRVGGLYNLGVLHTSLSGSSQHDTYAPTSVSILESKGYDYWALGHIHVRSPESLSERSWIGYSGNTQGRHIRESGPKGCQLITLQDGELLSNEFLPTDSLRWYELELDLSQVEHLGDIEEVLESAALPYVESSEGRSLAMRVRLMGATPLHAELTRSGTVQRLGQTLGARLAELGTVWLETIKISTRPTSAPAIEDLVLPLRYLQTVTSELQENPVQRAELESVLEELLKKTRSELAESGWPLALQGEQDAELTRLIGSAHDLLVARLASEEAE